MQLKNSNIRLFIRIYIFQKLRKLDCSITDLKNRLLSRLTMALLYLVSQSDQYGITSDITKK